MAAESIPAFVLAGTQSGSGKTTLTLGLLAALKERGLVVQPFKCGPDFIDPSLHRLVTGRQSPNLDLWMCGPEFVRQTFATRAADADVAVVEGVMGLFDGGESSSAALAKALDLPVVLVVDARSTAESVAAVVKGFESLDPELTVAGVILNRIGSPRHLQLASSAMERYCRTPLLGYLGREVDFIMPDRHLGLHMGDETPISKNALVRLAQAVAATIDLDRLLALAGRPQITPTAAAAPQVPSGHTLRIGVARDRAFCFYYQENLELLARHGAEIVPFSPLTDAALPENLGGIYLGGGYPELYGAALAGNEPMRTAIREWVLAGGPLYAECGGFMYLTEGITDGEGVFHPMAGVFPVAAHMRKGRVALGYRVAVTRQESFFGPAGTVLRGHEFHYSQIEPMPESVERLFTLPDGQTEGYRLHNAIGGYLHLHFGFNPAAAGELVGFCRRFTPQNVAGN